MKILVETIGPYSYLLTSGEYIRAETPTVIETSSFVESLIAKSAVKLIEPLIDTATDEEFSKFLSESAGDVALAQSSFLSKYGVLSSVTIVEESRVTRQRKVK